MERPDTLRRLCPSGLPILVRLAACRPPEEAELARCLAVGEGWLAEGRTGPESAALLLPYAADAAPAQALRRFTRAENTRGGWVVVLGPMDGANLRACLVYAAAGRRGVRPALGLAVQWPPGGPPPRLRDGPAAERTGAHRRPAGTGLGGGRPAPRPGRGEPAAVSGRAAAVSGTF